MIWWMDAYWEGKGTKEAQIQVKKFGSHKQSPHCRVYETVGCVFDSVAAARLEATGAPSRAIIKPAKPVHWLRLTTA